MKFEDLIFKQHDTFSGPGKNCVIQYQNGYGASIIQSPMSYGGKNGLYEVAVLRGEEICYTTNITNDVVGWLNEEGVIEILQKIEALKD